MKSLCATIASLGLLAIAASEIEAADAMPIAPPASTQATVAPLPETARLICPYRRCYRTGGYRYYYRPYGYYRPYYYGPRVGVGIGGVGIGIY